MSRLCDRMIYSRVWVSAGLAAWRPGGRCLRRQAAACLGAVLLACLSASTGSAAQAGGVRHKGAAAPPPGQQGQQAAHEDAASYHQLALEAQRLGPDARYLCSDRSDEEVAMAAGLPELQLQQLLVSRWRRRPTDITLVTQLSVERLQMLDAQCSAWSGAVSAAVYVPVMGTFAVIPDASGDRLAGVQLEAVAARVAEFHRKAEAKGLCKLDIQLYGQSVASVNESALYPVNAMRNRALAHASTEVVLLLDADFLPSHDLHAAMEDPDRYASLAQAVSGGNAVVLPAFEPSEGGALGRELVQAAVEGGKRLASAMYGDGQLQPFHGTHYKAGHRATDYARWIGATRPYRVRHEEGYEPYLLLARAAAPWFDERFIGYRKNKVSHAAHLEARGARFLVHPRAFVAHAPHRRGRAWHATRDSRLWQEMASLYGEVRARLDSGTYVPAARYACGNHTVGPLLGDKDARPAAGWASS